MILVYILFSVAIVSAISLIGLSTFLIEKKTIDKILFYFVSFATGALFGGAFLDLIPEAIEEWGGNIIPFTLVGILSFFILERFLFFQHCHKRKCSVHTFAYINLLGDGVHNFIDGMLIAGSFITDISLGIVTSLAIIFHEIPQEIGDFSILLYGGFERRKALFYNFLISLTAFGGALTAYFLSDGIKEIGKFLIPFGAGGFIYLAATDMLPELHKTKSRKEAVLQLILILIGIAIIFAVITLVGH